MTIAFAEPAANVVVERGRTTIADRVVDRVTLHAAVEDPDVLSAKASARVTGVVTALDISVTLRYPVPVAATTARVRSHVIARVEELTGLSVSRVDISVAALESDTKPRRRVL
ncbi:Asp23/Gls24 family envelope stress response protein [Kibdelosporangium aridum]|uniref:Asp23 family, cell envelope-related function n=1 Tax=Kibdelosporangium aridum TaxID=2030 RepID=A0A1Y5Y8C5_KIBAR|nr:Asp23/Gls24 family envelope stress response protein [Kibdelosporangium aridum]SMD25939.1 Asp23 family, cell envelope-related function [Kibdelosporangium aridum]